MPLTKVTAPMTSGVAATSHTHAIADVTSLQTFLDAKAASSHTHVKADVTDFAHTHSGSDITSTSIAPAKMTQWLTFDTAKNTSGTTVDFTGIPSWAKRITVMLQGVSTSGTSNLILQLGTGATPTYTNTGYLGSVSTTAGGATNFSTGFMLNSLVAATDFMHGVALLFNISGNNWCESCVLAHSSTTTTRNGAGSVSLAAVVTAVRVTTVNGADTFDGGSINISYEG